MPSHKDYEEAVDDPEGTFRDPDLRNAQPLREGGFPKPWSGNNAVVFQMLGNPDYRGDRGPWAVKCFTRPAPELKFRYNRLSEHLARVNLPFVVEFRYLENEMLVAGQRHPVVKMRWVEGRTLRQIVSENLNKQAIFRALCEIWQRIARRQHQANFTHCDLHHGNVLWVPGSRERSLAVKLIDLDGCWIPELAGFPSGELGLCHYQHPERMQEKVPYSHAVDRFSHLVIYTALRSLAETGRELWDRFDMDDNLLFTRDDFEACRQDQKKKPFSELLERLWGHRSADVKNLAGHVVLAASGALESVRPLQDILDESGRVRPLEGREADIVRRLLGVPVPKPADRPGSLYRNSLGMEFAFVPKGTFWMSKDDKNAQRQVTIPQDFYMGVYPVTQGEWEAVMGNNPSSLSHTGKGKDLAWNIPESELRRFPVDQVSWNHCQDFLKRLNERERESGWEYRLPTEAEWEYACRGAATAQEECSFDFYFKDNNTRYLAPELSNYGDSKIGHTTKVGSYPGNALGIHDMHGNVWEWCQDLHEKGNDRVVRGGSWRITGWGCRAAWRYQFTPVHFYDDTGVRIVRAPASPPKPALVEQSTIAADEGKNDPLLRKIKEAVAQSLGVDENTLTMQTSLSKDLRIDELDKVELVMALEESFNVTITDEDAERLDTVSDLYRYLRSHSTA
jgi:acyl carrier protein